MEPKVVDILQRIFRRIDGHMTLSRIQDVRHTHRLEVVHILDGVTVSQEDARIHLIAVHFDGSSLLPIGDVSESWHWTIFASSRVDDRVDQIVTGGLSRNGRRSNKGKSTFSKGEEMPSN